MISIKTKARLAGLASLMLAASCSTPSYHEEFKSRLGTSQDSIDASRYWDANVELISLVDDVSVADDPSYEMQGYAALYQLMRLHELASFANGFMTEAVKSRTVVDRKNGGKGPSRTGHMVASTYFAGKLLTLSPNRATSSRDFEGTPLLPPALDGLTVMRVGAYARLLLAGSYARLGFDSQAREMLFLSEGALAVFENRDDRADEEIALMLTDHDVFDPSQAWIYFTMHRFYRESVEFRGLAYRFGVRAVQSARAAKDGERPLRGKAAQWVAQLEVEFHGWIRGLDADKQDGGRFEAQDGTAYAANVSKSGEDEDVIDFRFQAHDSGSGF
ncbi:MAG: hypothetical protein ACI82F_004419 [Planctomycetota bacterium]|jgi:hypothetical protein